MKGHIFWRSNKEIASSPKSPWNLLNWEIDRNRPKIESVLAMIRLLTLWFESDWFAFSGNRDMIKWEQKKCARGRNGGHRREKILNSWKSFVELGQKATGTSSTATRREQDTYPRSEPSGWFEQVFVSGAWLSLVQIECFIIDVRNLQRWVPTLTQRYDSHPCAVMNDRDKSWLPPLESTPATEHRFRKWGGVVHLRGAVESYGPSGCHNSGFKKSRISHRDSKTGQGDGWKDQLRHFCDAVSSLPHTCTNVPLANFYRLWFSDRLPLSHESRAFPITIDGWHRESLFVILIWILLFSIVSVQGISVFYRFRSTI
jgi:hypothetical protein